MPWPDRATFLPGITTGTVWPRFVNFICVQVLEYQGEGYDRKAAMAAFLGYLPVTGDEEEGVQVHTL